MTSKQEIFCSKYLECGNASEAYRYAYNCSNQKDKTVWESASKLLKNPKVVARIKQTQQQLAKKDLISKEEIIKLNVDVINSDVLDFVQIGEAIIPIDDATSITRPTISFRDLESLPANKRRLIQKLSINSVGCPVIELMDKSKAVERISKMMGFDAPEKTEHTGKGGKELFPHIKVEVIDRREQVDTIHEDSND